MKKIKLIALASMVALGSVFLTNCTTGDTPDTVPTLEFKTGGNYISSDFSISANTNFTVGIEASHDKPLTSLIITVAVDGGAETTPAGCTLCDTVLSTNTFSADYVATTGAAAGTEVWTFTVSDGNGISTSKTITVTNLGAGGATLLEFVNDNNGNPHRVWNFIGPNAGAHQLGVGSVLSADPNADKDIQDSISAADGSAWPARWTSRNGTTFKVTTTHGWSTVTNSAELENAWNSLGTAESVINVVDGDVYIANIKNSGKYALIEVTDVMNTASDNLDYVQFRYKMAP